MTTPLASPAPVKPRWRKVGRWVVGLLLAYLLVAAVFTAFQARLIFPGSQTQGKPWSTFRARPGADQVTLTTPRGDRVVALFGAALTASDQPRPDAATCPTILFFYGNAMCLRDALGEFQAFRRLGANVLIPDYVGYGMSSGTAGEVGCRDTADAALAYLETRKDVDRSRIIAVGWSLGGAVALDLSARHPVAGVATLSSFTSMKAMARRVVPFLPASLLLRHRFDNLAKVAIVGCPLLIGHGRRDSLVPFAMSDELAAAAHTPVTRVTIDNADHNDIFDVGGTRVLLALQRFMNAVPQRPPPPEAPANEATTLQTRLIFPGSQTQGSTWSTFRAKPGSELVNLITQRGDRVVALFGAALTPIGQPRPDATTCPTVLYFYGNGMCLRDALGQFDTFRRLGANVLIPDYVGYGMSAGTASEIGCRETADAALAYLESRKDVDRSRIVAAGWSLGGAVALDLAARKPVAGVATFSAFTSMKAMARRVMPFLPTALLLRHHFDNLAKIPAVGCPVLIGHGRRDSMIPYAMSDELVAAARTPVTRITIDDADHNDIFDVGGAGLLTDFQRFMNALPHRP